MKVLIMNREEIEKTSKNPFSDAVGILSITDFEYETQNGISIFTYSAC